MPGTQMTLVLIGKDLVLKGSTHQNRGFKQVPGKNYIAGIYIWYIISDIL